MNICTPGNCICGAAEWAGDTNCMGEIVGVEDTNVTPTNYDPRYYWSEKHGVVFSVNTPEEMLPGVDYYLTPDDVMLRVRRVHMLNRGLPTREQAEELNSLRPVTDSPRNPKPKPPGPSGQRRRVFPIKKRA